MNTKWKPQPEWECQKHIGRAVRLVSNSDGWLCVIVLGKEEEGKRVGQVLKTCAERYTGCKEPKNQRMRAGMNWLVGHARKQKQDIENL